MSRYRHQVLCLPAILWLCLPDRRSNQKQRQSEARKANRKTRRKQTLIFSTEKFKSETFTLSG